MLVSVQASAPTNSAKIATKRPLKSKIAHQNLSASKKITAATEETKAVSLHVVPAASGATNVINATLTMGAQGVKMAIRWLESSASRSCGE
jgi:hypothetical protein